jgi:DNA-binding beta-propeller fold protein YncE
MVRIGAGNRQYEVLDSFPKLPEGLSLGYTHGIVTDEQDRVYLFNTSKDAVIVLTESGEYVRSWGEEFEAGAHGMLLNREDGVSYLYLTDVARGLVVKSTLDGETIWSIGIPDLPEYDAVLRPFVPTDVAVASNGDVYVADGYGQHRVLHYDRNGGLIRTWGGYGSAPGQLACPHGVSIVVRGDTEYVYVADRSNHRIQVFTPSGEHIRFVTEEMDEPCSFYEHQGELYIPDLKSRVTILDGQDSLIAHLGEDKSNAGRPDWPNLAPDSIAPGTFSSPHGVCVDGKGNIYVAEWTQHGRVTKLKPITSASFA